MITETMPLLAVEPLTRATFALFGDVIEADDTMTRYSINSGSTERYHDLARIDAGADGRAIVSIFRSQPRELPFVIAAMERHPKSSQAFYPLSGLPYLAVVARKSIRPALGDLRVFYCEGHQGVNYAPGIWHHPLLALLAPSDFLIIDRAGPGENCDIVQMDIHSVIPQLPRLNTGHTRTRAPQA
ncbi:MAG TPA: ureidoglycolate lyase [Burkholderiaceae bacterium]|nr:ureidoglycolate lyase [Burkholderiaceae bacterium]